MMLYMEIATRRLVLRPWKHDDPNEARSLYRFASDPQIGPRCGWMPHTSEADSLDLLNHVLTGPENYAITLRNGQDGGSPATRIAAGDPIGSIELKETGPNDHATSYVREMLDAHELKKNVNEDDVRRLLDHSEHDLALGYWIGRPFWGQGLMTEALEAMLQRAFGENGLGANAVWGGHYVENIGSGKVMEHCGLWPVGRKKDDYFSQIDEHHDCVLRVITRKEWEQRVQAQ